MHKKNGFSFCPKLDGITLSIYRPKRKNKKKSSKSMPNAVLNEYSSKITDVVDEVSPTPVPS